MFVGMGSGCTFRTSVQEIQTKTNSMALMLAYLPKNIQINQIDIIKTNSIKKAYMVIKGQEVPIQIELINKNEILLFSNNFKIKINKNNNEVSISDENKIHFLKCESETFNM